MPHMRAVVCSKCGVLLTEKTRQGGIKGICGICVKERQAMYRAHRKTVSKSVRGAEPVSGYDDLTPVEASGFVSWAVITTARRVAGGERSSHAAYYIYHDRRGEE